MFAALDNGIVRRTWDELRTRRAVICAMFIWYPVVCEFGGVRRVLLKTGDFDDLIGELERDLQRRAQALGVNL